MDDVLDCIRFVHMHRNVHGRISVMVPVLLRGEDCTSVMATVSCHQRVFDSLQEIRAPSIVQEGTGKVNSRI
jgi:hypothetical protein